MMHCGAPNWLSLLVYSYKYKLSLRGSGLRRWALKLVSTLVNTERVVI